MADIGSDYYRNSCEKLPERCLINKFRQQTRHSNASIYNFNNSYSCCDHHKYTTDMADVYLNESDKRSKYAINCNIDIIATIMLAKHQAHQCSSESLYKWLCEIKQGISNT